MPTWITPKTDWVDTDTYDVDDFNRIGGNIDYLAYRALYDYDFIDINDKVCVLSSGDSPNACMAQLDVSPYRLGTRYYGLTYADQYQFSQDAANMRVLMRLLYLTLNTPWFSSGQFSIYRTTGGNLITYTGYISETSFRTADDFWYDAMGSNIREVIKTTWNAGTASTGEVYNTSINRELENTPFWTATELNIIEGRIAAVKQRLDEYANS